MSCGNNLKQIGLAFHNYESTYKRFPSAYYSKIPNNITSSERSMWSWGAFILPFIEQQAMYDSLNPGGTLLETHLGTPAGLTLLQTKLPGYRCPSDSGPDLNNFTDSMTGDTPAATTNYYNRNVTSDGSNRLAIALSNYVMSANAGDSTTPPVFPSQYGPAKGVGFQNSRVGFGDIPDGTTNTILVGERAWRFADLTVGAGNALGFSAETCDQGGSWNIKSAQLAAVAITYDGINWRANNRIHQTRGYSSNHPGGAHFVMCDGSIQFISESIDYVKVPVTTTPYWTTLFARLACRNDGMATSGFGN